MNIFNTKTPKSGEVLKVLHESENVKISHITSSSKLIDSIFKQKCDEWVVLLEGEATLEIEGKKVRLKMGESLFIEANKKHSILECEDGTKWLAVYMINPKH